MKNLEPGMIITCNFPQKESLTLMITKIVRTSVENKISAYDYKSKTTAYTIRQNARNDQYITRNIAEENKLPAPGTSVICKETPESHEMRGIIKSFKNGYFNITFSGSGKKAIKTRYGDFETLPNKLVPYAYPDKNSPMHDWSISGYKEFPSFSEETIAFQTNLKRNKKSVLTAENSGKGEPIRISPTKTGSTEDINNFNENVRKWHTLHSKTEDTIEPETDWLSWECEYRPYGYSPEEYFKIMQKFSVF